jgi:tripartite-type tricarboxylate transporter receptor subunit TctC
MNHQRRSMLQALAAALAWPVAGSAQMPDGWPAHPVRVIIPFTPGGSTDILGREIAHILGDTFHQSFVPENKAGAGGSIGAALVASAPADGYTLLMGHIGTLAVNPTLYAKTLPYDPHTAFAPVALVARVPNVLAVNPALPVHTVAELVTLAKSEPGKLRYASGGKGSAAHIATEYFKLRTGVDIEHVPYRGTAPAVADVLAGHVEMILTGVPAVLPQTKAGKLRAIAVSTLEPVATLPGVPTIAATYPGFEAVQWYGVVAPAKTPPAIVDALNAAINRGLEAPALKARLDTEGAIAAPTTPAAFGTMIAAEIARWKPVIEKSNMQAD